MAATAALLAWRGIRLPAALTGVGCLLALWASPLPIFHPGPHWPFTLCALAGLLLLAITLLRPAKARDPAWPAVARAGAAASS